MPSITDHANAALSRVLDRNRLQPPRDRVSRSPPAAARPAPEAAHALMKFTELRAPRLVLIGGEGSRTRRRERAAKPPPHADDLYPRY